MTRTTDGAQGVDERGLRPYPGRPERRLALTFDAFDAHHHSLWLRYAHTQVGGRAPAESVVNAACARLLDHWPHVLVQESVPQYAWAVLKEEVARWLSEHDLRSALVDTAAFEAAARKLLLPEPRDQFTILQGELVLYAAISRLPERQYDVVVLRYVLGVPDEVVADYMGLDVATVHSQARHARRRLAKDLGVRATETEE
ncbi:RNA polymerase sigma factor [Streptomyces sp. NPDC051569]|uniref:RNA polymerase sigma factor n=1 Tax=Streptomyces sp. NPDC051569 TaxID=3365661 RepID=UPI0037BA08A3